MQRQHILEELDKPVPPDAADLYAPHALTGQPAAFCQAFVANGGNGTAAAVEAGYAPDSAHVRANRLLQRDDVRHQLQAELTIAREDPSSPQAQGLASAQADALASVYSDRDGGINRLKRFLDVCSGRPHQLTAPEP